ncbi:MAG: WG repeat-containing protein [Bacteroidota bacterium]
MTRQEFQKRYHYNNREHKIGGGSFGTVYKAYDRVLDRHVAIKVSEVKQLQGKEVSLQVEFDAIKSLAKHPNIANYESVHRFEDGPGVFDYAIMQYYPLGNLSSFIKKHELDEEKKGKILIQILEGLAYLHKKKVVHRDIKPGNILVVDRPGEGIVPKITDFGLSKLAEISGESTEFANSFAGGTVQYSSPEQLKGQSLKFNTDLWSFGVIVYEVFTGKSLFDVTGHSSASVEWQSEIMQQILHKDVETPLNGLSEIWANIAKQCLKRDNRERVKSGDALLNEIPDELKDPSPFSVGTEEEEDAGTVVLATATSDEREDGTVIQPKEETQAKTMATPKSFAKKGILIAGIVLLILAGLGAYYFMGRLSSPKSLARVELNGKTAFIDMEGNEIIPFNFSGGFGFSEGMSPVQKNGKWIYIDPQGNQAFEKSFDFAAPFSESVAAIREGKAWGYIDRKGTYTIAPKFELAGSFSNGYAVVQEDGKWGYIDSKGNIFIEPQFDAALEFSEGLGAVKKGNTWGYVNSLGSMAIAFNFESVSPFSNGLATASKGGTFFFIDKKGDRALDGDYQMLGNFTQGLAPAKLNGKWGYINKEGKMIIPSSFDRAGNFMNGLAPVERNNKWGFIGNKGEQIIDFMYDYADVFSKLEE